MLPECAPDAGIGGEYEYGVTGIITAAGAVEPLTHFFGVPREPSNGNAAAQAEAAVDMFARYYHHAAPFSRASLRTVFDDCDKDPSQAKRCAEVRAETERVLGSLADDGR